MRSVVRTTVILLLILLNISSPTLCVANFEICDNGIDDDGDDLIDLNDDDCKCILLEPKSLIPNPSFEEMTCCPDTRSQLSCAKTWIQASEPTTDYIHSCGWMGWPSFPPPEPFPDGDAIIGFRDGRVIQQNSEPQWKEYLGACLSGPLVEGTAYRFEFYVGLVDHISSPSINLSFFGSTDCANLPFGIGDENFGCPTNGPGWVLLGSTRIGGGRGWYKAGIQITPSMDIEAIVIGPACPAVISETSLYYFFDQLILADQRSFDFKITGQGHPCSQSFGLEVPKEFESDYQWYLDGVALPGRVNSQLMNVYLEGSYQVRIIKDGSCQLTKPFFYQRPVENTTDYQVICHGDQFLFGTTPLRDPGQFIDTFKTIHGCDSVVHLTLDIHGLQPDSISIKIFEGERYEVGSEKFNLPGWHHGSLKTTAGCDSTVFINLAHYDLYIPNVFTPNGDGKNDHFIISGNQDLMEISSMTIYDRWGKEIYRDINLLTNDSEGWDGKHKGTELNSGIYPFQFAVLMNDGIERQRTGSILLIR